MQRGPRAAGVDAVTDGRRRGEPRGDHCPAQVRKAALVGEGNTLFPSRRHLPRRKGQGRVAQQERGGRKAGLEEKVRVREGKGKRKRRKAPSSTSPLGAALQLLSNQLLNSIHCRDGTKKWLFIRILVWYCSVPHKRRFIMLGWGEKPLSSFFFLFFFFSLQSETIT